MCLLLASDCCKIVTLPFWFRGNLCPGIVLASVLICSHLPAQEVPAGAVASAPVQGSTGAVPGEDPAPEPTMYIREIRVKGVTCLTPEEIESAVYPFTGPLRSMKDVDEARSALEKACQDKGFKTVAVEVPEQTGARGIIYLKVVENTVGRLRIRGAKYFSPEVIKRRLPSMAAGRLPNFTDVTKDIVALSQLADLQVTPKLRPGVIDNTIDIDMEVKDTLPLHGSLELNNRYSANTTELRLNGAINYNNLWQAGHSLGLSFQVAPENMDDASVYSAYYLARLQNHPGTSLMFMGTKQDSNVSTLGGAAVAGRGEIIGARALFTLPGEAGFFQSVSVGMDYKHFAEDVSVGENLISTPIEYYPFTMNYSAAWTGKKTFTELNAAANWHFRGMGSDRLEFDNKRYKANGGYFYVRGDLSHTRELPGGTEIYTKVQGQAASGPLINSEQFSGGGVATARGYLESTALGDNGIFGTLELRSPSFIGLSGKPQGGEKPSDREWRLYGFLEGGSLFLNDALKEQDDQINLASTGVGTRIKLFGHFNASVDVAIPLIDQPEAEKGTPRVNFRLWSEF